MDCGITEIDLKLEKYNLHGVNLFSVHHLYNYLAPGSSKASSIELAFSCARPQTFPIGAQSEKQIYTSPYVTDAGESVAGIFGKDSIEVFRFLNVADFRLGSDRIDCIMPDSVSNPVMENYLFGPVLSYWLEKRGIPVLHASAISFEGTAVAFLANSGHGKSTLASAFVRAGHALITDDILPIEESQGTFWGQPGLPQIKLWPDQTEYLVGIQSGLKPVVPGLSKMLVPVGLNGFGKFTETSQPLRCIYLPCRSNSGKDDSAIEIFPLRPAQAVIELVRFTFIPNITESLGWQDRRLNFFSRMIKQVPVRRLNYPTGFDQLRKVTDMILQDLDKLPVL